MNDDAREVHRQQSLNGHSDNVRVGESSNSLNPENMDQIAKQIAINSYLTGNIRQSIT